MVVREAGNDCVLDEGDAASKGAIADGGEVGGEGELDEGTAFPTPSQFPQLGSGGSPAKMTTATSGPSGRGQTTCSAAAIAVSSSIDTGTPAPAVRLPLDPVPTHRNGTSFVQESGTRLDLYARSALTGQLATE